MCVFWVGSQCFSIYDPVAIASDILSLLHSSYTHTHTHVETHPTTLVNDLSCIECPRSCFSQVMQQAGCQIHILRLFFLTTATSDSHTQLTEYRKLTHILCRKLIYGVKFTAAYENCCNPDWWLESDILQHKSYCSGETPEDTGQVLWGYSHFMALTKRSAVRVMLTESTQHVALQGQKTHFNLRTSYFGIMNELVMSPTHSPTVIDSHCINTKNKISTAMYIFNK